MGPDELDQEVPSGGVGMSRVPWSRGAYHSGLVVLGNEYAWASQIRGSWTHFFEDFEQNDYSLRKQSDTMVFLPSNIEGSYTFSLEPTQ